MKGKYAGQEKLSDLVRATVTVNETKPNQVLEVLNLISKNPNFKLIRLKDKLVDLRHVNANFIF